MEDCINFADNSRSCQLILMKLYSGVRCHTSNKSLYFGVDRDHDLDLGIINRILSLWDKIAIAIDNCSIS